MDVKYLFEFLIVFPPVKLMLRYIFIDSVYVILEPTTFALVFLQSSSLYTILWYLL